MRHLGDTSAKTSAGQRLLDPALLESLRAYIKPEPIKPDPVQPQPIEREPKRFDQAEPAATIKPPAMAVNPVQKVTNPPAPRAVNPSPKGMNTSEPKATVPTESEGSFPPAGWLTSRQTAERLGVSLETLTCNAWKWRKTLRQVSRTVGKPGGGRINLYPQALVEKIFGERAEAALGPVIPDGHVDKHGACAWFGVNEGVWDRWRAEGKIRFGKVVFSSSGKKKKAFAITDLEALRDELFGEDKLYKKQDGTYHVPPDLMRREEACATFGVSVQIWERWEREGKITCGTREGGGPKLYKVEDIHRMLDEYGKYAPPYPDPMMPGVFRVPLSGRSIRRREAIIDATDVALIEGGSCAFSNPGPSGFVSLTRGQVQGTPLRRIIMGVAESGLQVGHRNEDPLDCRRENLIVRKVAERSWSARKVRTVNGQPPTSRFKGVYWESWSQKWRTGITCDGVQRRLGRFHDEIAAAEAYDEAAREFFGEHARLNFPDGVDAWLEQDAAKQAA